MSAAGRIETPRSAVGGSGGLGGAAERALAAAGTVGGAEEPRMPGGGARSEAAAEGGLSGRNEKTVGETKRRADAKMHRVEKATAEPPALRGVGGIPRCPRERKKEAGAVRPPRIHPASSSHVAEPPSDAVEDRADELSSIPAAWGGARAEGPAVPEGARWEGGSTPPARRWIPGAVSISGPRVNRASGGASSPDRPRRPHLSVAPSPHSGSMGVFVPNAVAVEGGIVEGQPVSQSQDGSRAVPVFSEPGSQDNDRLTEDDVTLQRSWIRSKYKRGGCIAVLSLVAVALLGTGTAVGILVSKRGIGDQAKAPQGMAPDTLQSTEAKGWVQLGQRIDGLAGRDELGISVELSGAGDRLIAGSPLHRIGGTNYGLAQVFDLVHRAAASNASGGGTDAEWMQSGSNIHGEFLNDAGCAVAISSDGNVVAVGAPTGYYTYGRVRAYTLDGRKWSSFGQSILGVALLDSAGESLALSADGRHLAVKSRYYDWIGAVRVFRYEEGSKRWKQLGNRIVGTNKYDHGDHSLGTLYRGVSMASDGRRVAVGWPGSEGHKGIARVFEYNETSEHWDKLGVDFVGKAKGDQFGRAVALSADGNRVALGSPYSDAHGSSSGFARVYQYQPETDAWAELGEDIVGESVMDRCGWEVSLSADGSILAAVARLADGKSNAPRFGYVRAFQFRDTSNAADGDVKRGHWIRIGDDIKSEESDVYFGKSISLSSGGTRLAIAAPHSDNRRGNVRVFECTSL